MLALLSLFLVILISFIVIRAAAILLELTGVSAEIAEFQALSAFTGTGFTTRETESLINHPTRRHIIKILIIAGNAGIMTIIASLILTFVNKDVKDILIHLIILSIGLVLMLLLLKSKPLYFVLKKVILKVIEKYSSEQIYDYHEILGLGQGFVISKIYIDEGNWMAGKQFKDLKLDREGTLVLNIEKREGKKKIFLGAPNGKTTVAVGDILTCYGRHEAVKSLAEREKGSEGEHEHQELCEKLEDVKIIEKNPLL